VEYLNYKFYIKKSKKGADMKKILYIEDDKDIAEAVKILLNNAGFHAETVSSGKEGLEKAKEFFDLFLIDIMLPDMSGWDIFESLKNGGINSKFAFLSAIPVSQERLEELKKAGVSDYITKPFSRQDLIKRIMNILIDKRTIKILYVEDNPDTAEAVKIILMHAGYEVEIAFSGKECLIKLKDFFDIILLDMMLPDMSGWDIFEALKKRGINSKFAFLSGIDADNKRVEELKKFGVSDYITKPFSKEDLIERINLIISSQQNPAAFQN
jgi:DNA-binding response OmpR family regulator